MSYKAVPPFRAIGNDIIDAHDQHIAVVRYINGSEDVVEVERTAVLLAASPLLLEALKLWAAGFNRGITCPGCGEAHNDGHQDTCACDHCSLVIKSRAAIEAATGKE